MALLKVSSRSNPNAVAGAFAAVVREKGSAEVHVVGAGAINQAIKAVAIARGYLRQNGIDLVCIPSFVEIDIDGQQRTAVRLLVESRTGQPSVEIDLGAAPADVATRDGHRVVTPPVSAGAPLDDVRVERSDAGISSGLI